jgi:predicted transcriptional regulator
MLIELSNGTTVVADKVCGWDEIETMIERHKTKYQLRVMTMAGTISVENSDRGVLVGDVGSLVVNVCALSPRAHVVEVG